MKKFDRARGKTKADMEGSPRPPRHQSGHGVKKDHLVPDSTSVAEMEEFEEFALGDGPDAPEELSRASVEIDRERWWSLLVKAVGGPDRLPES